MDYNNNRPLALSLCLLALSLVAACGVTVGEDRPDLRVTPPADGAAPVDGPMLLDLVRGEAGPSSCIGSGQWSVVTAPSNQDLMAVWGSAADDVWAVGWPSLLHYDGQRWSVVVSPDPRQRPLVAVWGSGRDDVWVATDVDYLLHWNGKDWTQSQLATDAGLDTGFSSLWGLGAGDVWLGGGGGGGTNLRRWNGTAWQKYPLPQSGNDVWHQGAQAIWGTSGSDVWFGGGFYGGGLPLQVHHWDGAQLAPVSYGSQLLYGDVTGIGGSGPSDVWFVREKGFLHWDGQQLTPQPGMVGGRSLSVQGKSDAWAVGGSDIRHWDGQTWTLARSDPQWTLNAVWGRCATDLWAVGNRGLLLHYAP